MTDVDSMIGEVPLDKPLRVSGSASLREVAGTMEDAHTSCVLVGANPPRIVTDHDLAGALAAGLGAQASVEQIATKAPVWATTSTTVRDAASMMINHGIRHLLVLTPRGEAQGMLTLATATRLLLDATSPLQVPKH